MLKLIILIVSHSNGQMESCRGNNYEGRWFAKRLVRKP